MSETTNKKSRLTESFEVKREQQTLIEETKLTQAGLEKVYGKKTKTADDWKKIACPADRVRAIKERLTACGGAPRILVRFRPEEVSEYEFRDSHNGFEIYYNVELEKMAAYDCFQLLSRTMKPSHKVYGTTLSLIGKFELPGHKIGVDRALPPQYVPNSTDEDPKEMVIDKFVLAEDINKITAKQLEGLYFVVLDLYFENLDRGYKRGVEHDLLEMWQAIAEIQD